MSDRISCRFPERRGRDRTAHNSIGYPRLQMSNSTIRSRLRKFVVPLLLTSMVAAIVLGVHLTAYDTELDFLQVAEKRLVDLRFRIRGPRPPSGDVVIVAIDSMSIERMGRWPWTRTTHARLVDKLREWGAGTVVFDVLFTEQEGVREAERLRRIAATLPASSGDDAVAATRAAFDTEIDKLLTDRAFAAALERTFEADAAYVVLGFDFVKRQML